MLAHLLRRSLANSTHVVEAVCSFPLCLPQGKLWHHLSLNEVNLELASVLSEAEAHMSETIGDVYEMQKMLQAIDMSLPPALPGAPDSVLHLLIKNTGGLHAAFQIRYPTEMELNIEHWADKGEPTEVELKQHLIVDKKIISVTPRHLEAAPGECTEVRGNPKEALSRL